MNTIPHYLCQELCSEENKPKTAFYPPHYLNPYFEAIWKATKGRLQESMLAFTLNKLKKNNSVIANYLESKENPYPLKPQQPYNHFSGTSSAKQEKSSFHGSSRDETELTNFINKLYQLLPEGSKKEDFPAATQKQINTLYKKAMLSVHPNHVPKTFSGASQNTIEQETQKATENFQSLQTEYNKIKELQVFKRLPI